MKRIFSFLLLCIMTLSLAACGSTENNTSTGSASSTDTASSDSSEQPSTQPPESEQLTEQSEENSNGSNILVAYFSLAGEQYNVGVIEEGNTSIIAHMIAEQTGADLFEIEAVTPYPETHSELLEVSQEEMADNARPEIVGTVENMADYDTVFVGFPNWWGDMPMIVYNFLESYDFRGKTIVPFCTHGGSGLSGTEGTIAGMYPDATMIDGFAISGTTAQNDREQSREEVTAWLKEGGFIE